MSEVGSAPRAADVEGNRPDASVSLGALAIAFLRIAIASFGGGLSAWARYVIVEERAWLSEQEFLSALTVCRVLPGANQVNMAVFVGTRFRGVAGALAALGGLIAVPLALLLCLGSAYFHYHEVPELRSLLGGAVAAAAGMMLSMGIKVAGPVLRDPAALVFAVVAFVTVGLLHWSLPLVVIALAPLAIAWFWPRETT